MSLDYIIQKANKLVEKYGTRDPFEIAENLGIHIQFVDNLKSLKGVYKVIKRNRWIFINSNLPPEMQKIVCAHELGHDQFHRSLAKNDGLLEFMLYQMDSRPEYEANTFASEVLLDDKDILNLINCYNYDAEQIANYLNSDINLVALKCANLKNNGQKLNDVEHRNDFLK